ncbi:MAG: Rpn family recombination-promoting nuclease/putative transposase [Spirochaetales bacterium]|nr:Rpn family recombination-promoting nuclease/putative transposase [Spirochaetales bacterium]
MDKGHIYDDTYKYIFSNKRIFLQLIKSFVTEDFVKDITLEGIDLVDRSFISEEFLSRESDIIYRITLKDTEAYIYILLEFQSTVDKSIPIRMLLYIIQFYDLLLRNSQKGLLPSVFPILLYNGRANWTIPSNVKELIDKRIPEKYIPGFEYYKIIEKDIPDDVLLKLHNLVSAIIYLEKRKDEKGLKEAINKVTDLIKDENIIDIRMFAIWFKRMFRQKVDIEEYDKITNLAEVKNMLTAIADEIMQKGIEKGFEKGIEKGFEKGIEKGEKKERCAVAKKMKDLGYSVNEISEITGLSTEEIAEL